MISGERKRRGPKWYETPFGKIKLKMIIVASRLPLIGKSIKTKYYQLPGVGNAKKQRQ